MKKLLLITVVCCAFNSLQAAIFLDQAQENIVYGFAYDNDSQDPSAGIRSQTFIPTAVTLDQLDLYLEVWQRNDGAGGLEKPYGDTIRADITVEDAGGNPIWNLDYTYDGSEGFKSEWFTFAVPSVTLTPGQTYKIVVVGYGVWRGDNNSTYPGVPDVVDNWPNYDYAFRTYGTIPEPATLCLFAAGLFAISRKKK